MVIDSKIGEQELKSLLLTTLLGTLPVALILYYSIFRIKIDAQGLHYKFFPAVWKWRLIPKDNIASVEISERKTWIEKFTYGYRRNRLNHTTIMNITGKKFLRFTLNDGNKFKIGAENPEEMNRALKRLLARENQ
jgi:hypothetical protein